MTFYLFWLNVNIVFSWFYLGLNQYRPQCSSIATLWDVSASPKVQKQKLVRKASSEGSGLWPHHCVRLFCQAADECFPCLRRVRPADDPCGSSCSVPFKEPPRDRSRRNSLVYVQSLAGSTPDQKRKDKRECEAVRETLAPCGCSLTTAAPPLPFDKWKCKFRESCRGDVFCLKTLETCFSLLSWWGNMK